MCFLEIILFCYKYNLHYPFFYLKLCISFVALIACVKNEIREQDFDCVSLDNFIRH